MVTIEGKGKRRGLVTAVAAVVTKREGINSVSPTLLQQGVRALKKGLAPQDYPEVVLACDDLAVGLSAVIPGIRVAAIAAEKDAEIPEVFIEVPCVVGLPNLVESISEGDLLILDGNQGVVCIDPDPQTLMYYQRKEEQRFEKGRIHLDLSHLPAKMPGGEQVKVYGYVDSPEKIEEAVEAGADGIFIDLREANDDFTGKWHEMFDNLHNKPAIFAINFSAEDLLRTAAYIGAPCQTTIVFPDEQFDHLIGEIDPLLQALEAEAVNNDEAGPVNLGTVCSADTFDAENNTVAPMLAVDLRESKEFEPGDYLVDKLEIWQLDREPESLFLILGEEIDFVAPLVCAGARGVVVNPEKVQDVKEIVRTTHPEETD